jgi:Co/Zn/Cd efflux system component
MNALSVHRVAANERPYGELLQAVHRRVAQFPIAHATVQVEPPGWEQQETHF